MNDLAQKVNNVVKEFSHFPGPIMQAQTKRIGKTVDTLEINDIPQLAEAIGRAIANFSNPAKGEEARKKILVIK